MTNYEKACLLLPGVEPGRIEDYMMCSNVICGVCSMIEEKHPEFLKIKHLKFPEATCVCERCLA